MRYLFRLNSNEDENAKCHAVAALQYWRLQVWVQSDELSAKVETNFQSKLIYDQWLKEEWL